MYVVGRLLHLCLAICENHRQCMCVCHPEVSPVTKHSTNQSLHILLPDDTSNIAKRYSCVDRIFNNLNFVMQTHHLHCERVEKSSKNMVCSAILFILLFPVPVHCGVISKGHSEMQ